MSLPIQSLALSREPRLLTWLSEGVQHAALSHPSSLPVFLETTAVINLTKKVHDCAQNLLALLEKLSVSVKDSCVDPHKKAAQERLHGALQSSALKLDALYHHLVNHPLEKNLDDSPLNSAPNPMACTKR